MARVEDDIRADVITGDAASAHVGGRPPRAQVADCREAGQQPVAPWFVARQTRIAGAV